MRLINKWWFWLIITLIILILMILADVIPFYYCRTSVRPEGALKICEWTYRNIIG